MHDESECPRCEVLKVDCMDINSRYLFPEHLKKHLFNYVTHGRWKQWTEIKGIEEVKEVVWSEPVKKPLGRHAQWCERGCMKTRAMAWFVHGATTHPTAASLRVDERGYMSFVPGQSN